LKVNPKRVLIVEDEIIIGIDIKTRLDKRGECLCDVVTSSEEALEYAEKRKPDLIIMDIALQGKTDGLQAAEHINDNYNIPIIFITAYSAPNILSLTKRPGFYDCIQKPFDDRALFNVVLRTLTISALEKKLKAGEPLSSVIDDIPSGLSIIEAASFRVKVADKKFLNQSITCYDFNFNLDRPCHTFGFPCTIEEIKKTACWTAHISNRPLRTGKKRKVEIYGYPLLDHRGKVSDIIEFIRPLGEDEFSGYR